MIRRSSGVIAIGVLAVAVAAPIAQSGSTNWDAKFRALPQASNIRATMERLSARPHHVGSPYDKDNAEWLLARFKEYGWDAQIEVFSVLFPTPTERVLELAGTDALQGEARRAGGVDRSDVESEERAAAELQRATRSTATSPARWST